MRRLVRLSVVALVPACAATAPAPASTATQVLATPLIAGATTISDLSLATYPDAGTHDFSADQGQIVVLDAWATWCGPCTRSLPLLQALRRDYAARGVRVYAVSVDEDRAQIPRFLASARVDLPVLLDPGGYVLEEKLKLKLMPTTWVVDRAGQVRFTQEMFGGNLDDVREQVDVLLREAR
ncbi:MAG TPA: TlpA disulfide reductase family protein [Myxococcaceae bacterium]|nr:TlpA disulfide reductase family protein [Myxococcaceae bacterium]